MTDDEARDGLDDGWEESEDRPDEENGEENGDDIGDDTGELTDSGLDMEHGEDPDAHLDEVDLELIAEAELDERRRRMIKLLPNGITTCAMFFGFFAAMMAIEKNFVYAVWGVVIAAVCDMMDGRVARLTKSTSPFGIEYDSLSDLISFGVAPAMIAYFWALESFGRLGWAAAFVYIACAAMRLAKFNTLTGEEESRRYFRGIPSPAAAGLVIMMVMMHIALNPEFYREASLESPRGTGLTPESFWIRGGMLIWVVAMGFLMVSNVRFRTFKDVNFTRFGPFFPLVALAAAIAVFMSKPYHTLFALGTAYLATGLIEGGVILRRREKGLREAKKRLRKARRRQRKIERKEARQARKKAKRQRKSDAGRAGER